jgi:RNA polymerase sigma-70 factor
MVRGSALWSPPSIRREALLSPPDRSGREGKIAQYRGRGPLASWLEASAQRRAATLKGTAKPFDDLAEIAAQERAGAPDHLRLRYPNGFGQQITNGVTAALRGLSSNDHTLLRTHLVDGFSLRKLAHIRGVNVNVIARDLATVRAAILDQIRAALVAASGLSEDDARAVMNALFTRVNLGITAALKTGRASDP